MNKHKVGEYLMDEHKIPKGQTQSTQDILNEHKVVESLMDEIKVLKGLRENRKHTIYTGSYTQ